jgi:hypothetical protein
MTIKGKPKSLDSFLSGPTEEETAAPAQPSARPTQRITKTIRISAEVEAALKEAAYTRSREAGQRVAESDLIDEALKKYLNI